MTHCNTCHRKATEGSVGQTCFAPVTNHLQCAHCRHTWWTEPENTGERCPRCGWSSPHHQLRCFGTIVADERPIVVQPAHEDQRWLHGAT